ncbi:hypothetical protein [Lelliottia sp. RWM.1]|uniref:hypothetical protein n=1 Tax=Lelliottia sp. RWM.1 TaxID=2663242 RepID=UPI00193E00FE|nr:hypothetical protein [Lelliottia sp. RWM.1]MBM3072872.1 hypothetical protein [Lelliottia sp. RWM.1]
MTENEYQSAIMDAIAIYCAKNDLTCTNIFTYANQQGENSSRSCFDFMSYIENQTPLYAEVKVHDCKINELIRYDQEQYIGNCHLEDLNIPIKYVYNNTDEIAGLSINKDADSFSNTLKQSNYSLPRRLFGKKPDVSNHDNLWNWLITQGNQGGGTAEHSNIEEFGILCQALKQLKCPNNGILIMLYSTEGRFINGILDEETATDFIDLANRIKSSGFTKLTIKQKGLMESFLSGIDNFQHVYPAIEKEILLAASKKDKRDRPHSKPRSPRA